jgi:hypothetical protein
MVEKIFVIILCVIVAGAAIWGWWIENGNSRGKGTGEEGTKDPKEDV